MPLTTGYSLARPGPDHFEPSDIDDPKAQRQLHARLEQIDYAVYAANRKETAQSLGSVDPANFERLAAAAARARCAWIAAALEACSEPGEPCHEQTARLSHLRAVYDELAAAY